MKTTNYNNKLQQPKFPVEKAIIIIIRRGNQDPIIKAIKILHNRGNLFKQWRSNRGGNPDLIVTATSVPQSKSN